MWAAKWGGLLPASQYKYLLRTKRVCNQCYFEESTHRQQRAPASGHSSFVLFFPSVLPSSLITLSLQPSFLPPLLSFLIILPRLLDLPCSSTLLLLLSLFLFCLNISLLGMSFHCSLLFTLSCHFIYHSSSLPSSFPSSLPV